MKWSANEACSNSDGRKRPNQQSGNMRRIEAKAPMTGIVRRTTPCSVQRSRLSPDQGPAARLVSSSASNPCGTTRRQQKTQRPDQSRWGKLKPQKRSRAIPPATDEGAKDSHFRVAAAAQKPTDKDIAPHRSHFKLCNPTFSSAFPQHHSARIAVKVLSRDKTRML